MTKRRPWWSKRLATAIAAGVLLAGMADPGWAAQKSRHASKARVQAAKRPAKPTPRHLLADEVGTAEILPADTVGLHGKASFYSPKFHGRQTATGERFDSRALTGASNHFPLNTWVAVRRLDTGRCVAVQINDRMSARQTRRVIDLSRAAAEELRMISAGVVLVRIAPIRAKPPKGGLPPEGSCQEAFLAEEAPVAPPESEAAAMRGGIALPFSER